MKINLRHVDVLDGTDVRRTFHFKTGKELRQMLRDMKIRSLAPYKYDGAVDNQRVILVDDIRPALLDEETVYSPCSDNIQITQQAFFDLGKQQPRRPVTNSKKGG